MRGIVLAIAAWAALSAGPSLAAPRPGNISPTPAERQELAQFQLTEDSLDRFIAATHEIAKEAPLQPGAHYSISDFTQAVADSPAATAIVAKHGFTAHTFAMTFVALVSAAIIVMADEAKQPGASEGLYSSDYNIDFYRAHRAKIDAFLGNRAAS